MSFYSIASGTSIWRGYDYYKNDKILYCDKITNTEFVGVCEGSNEEKYKIYIDTEHPKRSTCNCPHAEGTRRCCKHKIALFFTAFPDEAEKYYNDLMSDLEEQERYEEEIEMKIDSYIDSLKKSELKQLVYDLLYNGPDWQYDRFVKDYIEYYNNYRYQWNLKKMTPVQYRNQLLATS